MNLLICNDCNGDGVSAVTLEQFGTKYELSDRMYREFANEVGKDPYEFSDARFRWDGAVFEDDGASVWMNDASLGDRHVSWWQLGLDGTRRYVLIRIHVEDGGGLTVKCLGSYDERKAACVELRHRYELEVEHPSFYAGWDPEYCECDDGYAELTVETMDAQVSLVVLDKEYEEPMEEIEYIG